MKLLNTEAKLKKLLLVDAEEKKNRQNSRSCLEIKKNQRGTGSEKDSSISRIIPEFNECKRQMRCKNKINQKV